MAKCEVPIFTEKNESAPRHIHSKTTWILEISINFFVISSALFIFLHNISSSQSTRLSLKFFVFLFIARLMSNLLIKKQATLGRFFFLLATISVFLYQKKRIIYKIFSFIVYNLFFFIIFLLLFKSCLLSASSISILLLQIILTFLLTLYTYKTFKISKKGFCYKNVHIQFHCVIVHKKRVGFSIAYILYYILFFVTCGRYFNYETREKPFFRQYFKKTFNMKCNYGGFFFRKLDQPSLENILQKSNFIILKVYHKKHIGNVFKRMLNVSFEKKHFFRNKVFRKRKNKLKTTKFHKTTICMHPKKHHTNYSAKRPKQHRKFKRIWRLNSCTFSFFILVLYTSNFFELVAATALSHHDRNYEYVLRMKEKANVIIENQTNTGNTQIPVYNSRNNNEFKNQKHNRNTLSSLQKRKRRHKHPSYSSVYIQNLHNFFHYNRPDSSYLHHCPANYWDLPSKKCSAGLYTSLLVLSNARHPQLLSVERRFEDVCREWEKSRVCYERLYVACQSVPAAVGVLNNHQARLAVYSEPCYDQSLKYQHNVADCFLTVVKPTRECSDTYDRSLRVFLAVRDYRSACRVIMTSIKCFLEIRDRVREKCNDSSSKRYQSTYIYPLVNQSRELVLKRCDLSPPYDESHSFYTSNSTTLALLYRFWSYSLLTFLCVFVCLF